MAVNHRLVLLDEVGLWKAIVATEGRSYVASRIPWGEQ
jgi:hypothetical protein